jgi:predicted transcriptional regulator
LGTSSSPAEELFAAVRSLIARSNTPKTDAEIASELNVSKTQAKEWISRLVDEGVLEKTSRPIRYRPTTERPRQESLFE